MFWDHEKSLQIKNRKASNLQDLQVDYYVGKPMEEWPIDFTKKTMRKVFYWQENLFDQVAYSHQIHELKWQTNHGD